MNLKYHAWAADWIRWRSLQACSIFCLLLNIGTAVRAQGIAPRLESVTPSSVPVGWTGTILASGMFGPGEVLILGGSPLPTTFVNFTQLSATVPCCYTSIPNTYSLVVAASAGSSTQSFPLPFTVGSPPVIFSLTPDSATIGGPSVTVTINGANFESGAVAYALDQGANGGPVSTTFVSSTQLKAVIPASFFANFQPGQNGGIVIHNPDGGLSGEMVFYYVIPSAQITGISPASIAEGGSSFTLTVTGTNFYADALSVVTWNEQRLTTTYVSPTQLTASVSAPLITSPGTYQIAVESYTAGSSPSVPFLVVALPAITGVSPSSAAAGSPTFSLTVMGNFFNSASVVWWNNTALTTFFVSASQLTASVPATLLTAPGSVNVSVVGAVSSRTNNIAFSILAPTVSSISPTSATTGTAGQILAISGVNFVPGSQVNWNGTSLTTTVVSGASLTATVPASLLATPGIATVTVVNPGGAKSNELSFAVNGPAITAVNPASAAAGTSNLTLTVSGSAFAMNSSVLWNGSPLPTAFVSVSQLTAPVPASLTAVPGSNSITVYSGSSSSNAFIFTLTAVAPVLSTLSPQSVNAGNAPFTLTVSGSGFYAGAGVLWNGQPLPTAWVSPTQLTAAVAASLISQPGSIALAVSSSAGVSNLLSFSITPAGPVITAAGIVDSASGAPQIAPGSLVSLFGVNMATTTAAAAATPLPRQLAGASVTVNGNPAPLLYASPTQINFQLPYETPAGNASLAVSLGTGAGSPVSFAVVPNAPGVFVIPPSNHAVAVNYADGNLNSAQDPVQPGNYLTVYLTGLGAVDNTVPTGAVAPDSPLSNALVPVSVTIGGQRANVAFAGLTPGLVGVFQINLLVPAVSPGEELLAVTANGVTANATVVSIGGAN